MKEQEQDSMQKIKVKFRDISAFEGLSEEGASYLEAESKLLKYRIGQPLSSASTMPNQALWVLDGKCRLLSNEKDRLETIALMGPGASVGIASILRAKACESVTAATDVLALAVPDKLLVEFYVSEPSFRKWCDGNLWAAEIAELLREIQIYDADSNLSVAEKLAAAAQACRLAKINDNFMIDEPNHKNEDKCYFLASANTSELIGKRLDHEKPVPTADGPFGTRVIWMPPQLSKPVLKKEDNDSKIKDVFDAPLRIEKSGLYLGQKNSIDQIKVIEANGEPGETLACFQMICKILKVPFRRDSIEKVLIDNQRRGQSTNLQICGQLGSSLGLHVVSAKAPAEFGSRLQIPSMVYWDGGFAVATKSDVTGLTLASPRKGLVKIETDNLSFEFPEGIEILTMERTINTPELRFGPGWFIPAISRYRAVLAQVLVASFVVQLFGLANPLLIQVIIDKVISQRSLDTLQVLGIGLVVVTILEGLLGSLRTFLFAETTNRIDQRLGAEVIDHLLRLPLGYFDKRPVGELGTRVAELEKIRNFLTGTALTSILDAAFSVIYIIVMAMYSWLLTIIALIVLPIQVAITLIGAPLFRRQFRQAAEQNAKTQSHLVEVLTGVQTVKAQNVEMVSRWKWQEYYSKYIGKTFEKTITATAVSETSQVLQKLSQLLVLWVGAALVLNGELTLGQLIAFRIISGYVTQPLLRLSTIWQNIQELKVSFERLADVIDTPIESNDADQAKIPLPPVSGRVQFEDVNFKFQADQNYVLRKINLDVKPGTFVGIVGQSGSGKSTLMKLLPRLYSPNSGKVKIDGYDIDKTELYSLRRQIGIVPQEPLLFSGTVAENIGLTNPDASADEIVNSAKLACAHEFIMELPLGYSTPVGERGGSLSGGQKQRIAIARTLLNNPKLLVMDEATSALDYATEKKVCDNLIENLKDCTVFFITHRLSTIKRADLVVMMDKGAIVEEGSHDELISKAGRYFALFRQQEAY